MSRNQDRDAVQNGIWRLAPEPIRPPWFKADAPFTGACDGCGRCIIACPESILLAGRAGTPEVDFTSGACTFCGDCVAACPRDAFRPTTTRPWDMVAKVGDGCLDMQGVTCRICAEFCDAGAIRFRQFVGGYALPEVREDLCTGCGACVASCPSGTITIVDRQAEVPKPASR